MNSLEPFDYVVGLSSIALISSFIEMNEALRFLILLFTFMGILVKTWEQIRKSDHFLNDIRNLWKKRKDKD